MFLYPAKVHNIEPTFLTITPIAASNRLCFLNLDDYNYLKKVKIKNFESANPIFRFLASNLLILFNAKPNNFSSVLLLNG